MPKWVLRLVDWEKRHLISEKELQNALTYLDSRGITWFYSKKSPDALAEKNKEIAAYQSILSDAYSKNLFVSHIEMFETKHPDGFSGTICKKQNDIITLEADYSNDDTGYRVIFFRLKVFDGSGNFLIDGLSKIVDVAPKSFRHVSVSAPAVANPSYCTVDVDSKFP
jgi:hypothetical protein